MARIIPRDVDDALHPLDGPEPPQPLMPVLLGAASGTFTDHPTEATPPFINRRLSVAEWVDYCARYQFGSLTPSKLVLHHTYRPDEPAWNGLATMRGMQRFYAGKGWRSGPHIFTGPDGIWLATPMSQIGIHAGTGNGSLAAGWYSIGLEMVGFFDSKLPSGKVWDHAVIVMGELSRRLGIPPRQLITFHRDYSSKTCPGSAVSKEWVWAAVESYLGADAPTQPGPTILPGRFRTVAEAKVREAPNPHAPVAWKGQAVLPAGWEGDLTPLSDGAWLHWQPAGFVAASDVAPVEQPPGPNPAFEPPPVYTADSPLLNPTPYGTRAQFIAAFGAMARAARNPYYDVPSLTLIGGTYWDVALSVQADPWLVAAQCFHETGILTAALSHRTDKHGNPLRNPAGIGVNGETAPGPRPGFVWDADRNQYRRCVGFRSWVAESIPAHVGRYVAYALAPAERTPAQQHLVDRALAFRDLPLRMHGSADVLRKLGQAHNPTGQGWAYPGTGYGAAIAAFANRLIRRAAEDRP